MHAATSLLVACLVPATTMFALFQKKIGWPPCLHLADIVSPEDTRIASHTWDSAEKLPLNYYREQLKENNYNQAM